MLHSAHERQRSCLSVVAKPTVKPARVNRHLTQPLERFAYTGAIEAVGYFFVKLKKSDLCAMRLSLAAMVARGGRRVGPDGRSLGPFCSKRFGVQLPGLRESSGRCADYFQL